MSASLAGDPAPTNPSARREAVQRLRVKVTAERALPASEQLMNMLQVTRTTADAQALLDAIRAEERAKTLAEAAVVALNLRQFEKASGARAGAQVSENVGIIRVADELMRLADGGESRG